jgi:4-amino-4-deoxy-L-arabinose transferase-like glycosyltransferase
VGSSGDNSELTLIVGYNGLNRLVGMARNRGMAVDGTSPTTDSPQPGSRQSGMAAPSGNTAGLRGNPPQNNAGQAPATRPQANDGQPSGNRPQGGGGGTPSNIGQAGLLRLFTSPLSKEASWLLPIGLVSMALLLAGTRLKWPLSSKHQALVLWGGWLLTGGVFFSIASYFHEYYLSLLGAPQAALVGVGIIELWEMRKHRPLFAILLILVTAGVTMGFQIYTARAFVNPLEWLPLLFGVFLIGALLLIVAAKNQTSRNLALAGFTLIVISLFITPGIWSAYTAMNPGRNLSLPAAYSGKTSSPANRGSLQINQNLVDYLEANTQNTHYLMAVPTSMQGADYVLATGRPVLYMGGFKGSDTVVSADDLAQLVQAGELRYIYLSGGNGTQSGISSWTTSACTQVEGFETTSRNAGAPDGTTAAPISKSTGVPGNNQAITLYDCGDY